MGYYCTIGRKAAQCSKTKCITITNPVRIFVIIIFPPYFACKLLCFFYKTHLMSVYFCHIRIKQ